MSVDIPVGADFKKWDPEQCPYMLIVFLYPFSRHEEGGGDLLINQIIDQRLVVACSFPHRAEVERQGNSGTRGRA